MAGTETRKFSYHVIIEINVKTKLFSYSFFFFIDCFTADKVNVAENRRFTRLGCFDQMKGVAILLVVIGHVLIFSYGTNNNSVFQMLTIFHMPIFFYISGYFAYRHLPNIAEFGKRLWKRTHALLFPYLVFAALYCFFAKKDFVQLLLCGGAEYWFLYVLFLLSVFFLLFEQIAGHVKITWLYVLIWLIPYAAILFIQYRYGEIGGGEFAINQLAVYYRYYLIGFLCRKYSSLNNFLFTDKYVYALCLVCFFVKWYLYDSGANLIVSMLGTLGGIIILQNFFVAHTNDNSFVLKILSYAGRNSLEIYLLQYFFLPDLRGVVANLIDVSNGFIWQLSLAILLTIPIIAACLFVGKIIKSNSLLSWIMLGK